MSIVILQYRSDTPSDRLRRHHRIARWIMYPCGFFALGMFSSIAQILLFGAGRITIGFMILSVCAFALLAIPAVLCIPWINDIERELTKRSIPIPGGVDIDRRIRRLTWRLIGWTLAIIVGPVLVRPLVTYVTSL